MTYKLNVIQSEAAGEAKNLYRYIPRHPELSQRDLWPLKNGTLKPTWVWRTANGRPYRWRRFFDSLALLAVTDKNKAEILRLKPHSDR